MIGFEKHTNNIVTNDIKIALYFAVNKTLFSAR